MSIFCAWRRAINGEDIYIRRHRFRGVRASRSAERRRSPGGVRRWRAGGTRTTLRRGGERMRTYARADEQLFVVFAGARQPKIDPSMVSSTTSRRPFTAFMSLLRRNVTSGCRLVARLLLAS